MTKAKQLVTYDRAELERLLSELRRELVGLKFQSATGQLTNSARIGYVKKEIARILTIIRESELEIAHIPAKASGKIMYVKKERIDTKESDKRKQKTKKADEKTASEDELLNESEDLKGALEETPQNANVATNEPDQLEDKSDNDN